MKKILAFVLAALCSMSVLAGCGGGSSKKGGSLVIWASNVDQAYVNSRVAAFIDAKLEEDPTAVYDITVRVREESDIPGAFTDVEEAADLFYFIDDQMIGLVKAGALRELPNKYRTQVTNENIPGFAAAATYEGKMYAFPKSADNTYYLYYDKRKAPDGFETVADMFALAGASSVIRYPLTNAWQGSAFLFSAGGTIGVNAEGRMTTTFGDSTVVSRAYEIMNAFFTNNHVSTTAENSDIINGFTDQNTLAAVSGTWNYEPLKDAIGDNLGMQALPAFKFTGDAEATPMVAFGGFKMLGINRYIHEDNVELAYELASFLTNKASQTAMFNMRNYGPSNKEVLESAEVQGNELLSVVAQQFENSVDQSRVLSAYWGAVESFLTAYRASASTITSPSGTFTDMVTTMVNSMTASAID